MAGHPALAVRGAGGVPEPGGCLDAGPGVEAAQPGRRGAGGGGVAGHCRRGMVVAEAARLGCQGRALAIEANNATGTIQDVKYVVLLMLENRSFDSYFGTFRGVRGYGDRHPIPLANGKNAFYQTDADGKTETPYHLDSSKGNAQRAGGTPHVWSDAKAAWDHGRMNRWPDRKSTRLNSIH